MEIGKYGAHGVKFIGEILGDTGRTMTNPDGGADIPVPGTNEPAITIKAAMIMNTYTMYDLDTLVFSQGVSSTTPAPANDWVYIEANTGTGTNPSLTGMTYNVPTNKSHQFKINGSHVASIDSTGLNANDIGNGTVAAARLGTGSSITSKFLRGDNTWQTVSGGGSSGANTSLSNLTSTGESHFVKLGNTSNWTAEQNFNAGIDLGSQSVKGVHDVDFGASGGKVNFQGTGYISNAGTSKISISSSHITFKDSVICDHPLQMNSDIGMQGGDVEFSGGGRIDLQSTGGSPGTFDGYVAIKVGGSTKYIQIFS